MEGWTCRVLPKCWNRFLAAAEEKSHLSAFVSKMPSSQMDGGVFPWWLELLTFFSITGRPYNLVSFWLCSQFQDILQNRRFHFLCISSKNRKDFAHYKHSPGECHICKCLLGCPILSPHPVSQLSLHVWERRGRRNAV